MKQKVRPATMLLRVFCAMVFLSVGFGHRAPAALANETQSVAYVLPDGSFADLCIADGGKSTQALSRIARLAVSPGPSCCRNPPTTPGCSTGSRAWARLLLSIRPSAPAISSIVHACAVRRSLSDCPHSIDEDCRLLTAKKDRGKERHP